MLRNFRVQTSNAQIGCKMFTEFKFTPGVGLSLLIGAVGSVYLIVQSHRYFSKLSQRRRSTPPKTDAVVCSMCNSNIEIEDPNSFATCRGCERLVCQGNEGDNRCCDWIPAIGIWECRECHSNRVIQQKAGQWLLNQLTHRLQNPGPVNLKIEGSLLGLAGSDLDETQSSTSSISSNQKVKVREFIEELLSTMLNGPLDDVSVGEIMNHESYLPLCEGQQIPDSPSDQYFELRKLIQRILEEVAKLPDMLNLSGYPLRPEEHLPYFSPRKYEQLLATAVLNKVVEDYRNPKNFEHDPQKPDQTGPPTIGSATAGSAPPAGTGTTFDINHNKVPGKSQLNEANLRQMSLDTEEAQSREDSYGRSLSESDESYLSDYIQKHTVPLPDLSDTTGSGSGPEDDLISLKSNTTDGTWEENWLFKKRQLKATETSIAMLVPSPTEEVKALIGDKNADEVSDLSEAGSDVEEYDSDSNRKDTTAESAGVKTSFEDPTQDSLISINSIPSHEPVLSEATNDRLIQKDALLDTYQNSLTDDLISIDPNVDKTEASNPAVLGNVNKPLEINNNHDDATDDIKLMQERIQNAPKPPETNQTVGNVETISSGNQQQHHTVESDRKEIPIDRAQSTGAPPVDEVDSAPLVAQNISLNGHGGSEVNGVGHHENESEKLIPGSIAEREHLKWRNASPIPNNPYSPDVLQKRLSESKRNSVLHDLERLASREGAEVDSIETIPATEVQPTPDQDNEVVEADRSLQSVLGSNPIQYQRYGRDYYINDAKRASGSRKLEPEAGTQQTHSTDDEKSLLLSQKNPTVSVSKPTSPMASPSRKSGSGTFPFIKSSSCGNVIAENQTEDIFSAGRPVEVTSNDPVLQKATKLGYLSTPGREVYLIPADEPVIPRSNESSGATSMASRPDESLTYSEDSDVTRIYEIGTGEAKLIQGDALRCPSVTPPPTPVQEQPSKFGLLDNEKVLNKLNGLNPEQSELMSEEILEIIPQVTKSVPESETTVPVAERPTSPGIDRTPLLKPRYVQVKQLSPETIKFFSPKKPFSSPVKSGNLSESSALSKSTTEIRDLPQQSTNQYHSTLHIDFPASRTVPSHDFIIEKDVIEVLPSVKELAKCYSGSQQDVSSLPKPLFKPRVKLRKDFIRQSSDMIYEEPDEKTGMPKASNKNRRLYSSTSSINAAEELREIRRLNLEAYNRPTFVPMAPGHSITARSLSKQIREELKINATDDTKVLQDGHHSPERPSSPVFVPGQLRNSIQFFENLSTK